MDAFSSIQGGLIVFLLFVIILVASFFLTVLAIVDFVMTIRKRAALYTALGAEGGQGSALLWSSCYAVVVLGFSILSTLLFVIPVFSS